MTLSTDHSDLYLLVGFLIDILTETYIKFRYTKRQEKKKMVICSLIKVS